MQAKPLQMLFAKPKPKSSIRGRYQSGIRALCDTKKGWFPELCQAEKAKEIKDGLFRISGEFTDRMEMWIFPQYVKNMNVRSDMNHNHASFFSVHEKKNTSTSQHHQHLFWSQQRRAFRGKIIITNLSVRISWCIPHKAPEHQTPNIFHDSRPKWSEPLTWCLKAAYPFIDSCSSRVTDSIFRYVFANIKNPPFVKREPAERC